MSNNEPNFELRFNKYFLKKIGKITKNNKPLEVKLDRVFEILAINPHYASLKTHKVNSKRFDEKYSSSVTGDLRIIWDFDKTTKAIEIIEVFDLGGHSDKGSVY